MRMCSLRAEICVNLSKNRFFIFSIYSTYIQKCQKYLAHTSNRVPFTLRSIQYQALRIELEIMDIDPTTKDMEVEKVISNFFDEEVAITSTSEKKKVA